MNIAAIIVAAGRGTRAGGDLPKQWQSLGHRAADLDDEAGEANSRQDACNDTARGTRVIDHAIAAFRPHAQTIVVVHRPEDTELVARLTGIIPVCGGATRCASVKAGLEALAQTETSHVLIHDAARALVPSAVIDGVIGALRTHRGAAPALPVTDALWRGDTLVRGTQPREGLFRAQTPQGFAFDAILAAHRQFDGKSASAADDVEVARAMGIDVAITNGSEENFKITHPDDFARATALLQARNRGRIEQQRTRLPMDIRLGNGYDVHRFGAGDHVWLCGVKIPHTRALQGHSDADVGMHALTDAIYGALAEGDIGRHFPPSDMKWKGAESHIFLRHAIELARSKGFALSNCDVTLVCEYPKVGPHAAAMQAALAAILDVDADRVSVKATTSERLGFTGREEGIASIATATLIKT